MHRAKLLLVCSLFGGALLFPGLTHADESGWADLHAHPMTHLAFGYNHGPCADSEGIFHGKPGGTYDLTDEDKGIASDLGTCETDTHSKCPTTIVERGIRTWLLGLLENRLSAHGSAGAPSFEFWPHALSRTHQQMHVKWLRQAYDAGQRVMIASITESELLARAYHWEEGATCVVPDPQEGELYEVAMRQIAAIREFANANSDWMVVAEDPETALEEAFGEQEKLVLILGLEMDNLTEAEVLSLVDEGVRSVIPIHITDNEVGGTAVYSDLFNSLNYWQNGSFLDVDTDPNLEFRLGDPRILEGTFEDLGCAFGLSDPQSVYDGPGCGEPDGHVNRCGLRSNTLLHELMRRGVIIDVAHMSQLAVEDTIRMAEDADYPLINSHTSLRDGSVRAGSERDMTIDHAQRIAALGGMIGLGTVGDPPADVFFRAKGGPLEWLSEEKREWVGYHLPTDTRMPTDWVDELAVRIRTGGDNLGNDSMAFLLIDDGTTEHEILIKDTGETWDDWEVNEVTVDLNMYGLTVGDIDRVGVRTEGDESWNIDRFDVTYTGRDMGGMPTGNLLVTRSGHPYQRLTEGSFTTAPEAIRPREDGSRDARVHRLFFDWDADFYSETGGGWTNSGSIFRLHLDNGSTIERAFSDMSDMTGGEFGDGLSTFTWELTGDCDGIRYGDIVNLEVVTELAHTNEIKVEDIHVEWQGTDASGLSPAMGVLVDSAIVGGLGDVTHWLRRDRLTAELWRGLDPDPAGAFQIDVIRTHFATGSDDLEAGTEATLELLLRDGSVISRSLNRGRKWTGSTATTAFVPPIDPIDSDDIVSVRVLSDRAGGLGSDNWDLQGFELARAEDPMQPWIDAFTTARAAISAVEPDEGRIALGTDFNGLETQMPFVLVEDPADSENLLNLPISGVRRGDETLDRTFSLEEDGLAHYGLLKDFIDHAAGVNPAIASELFQTAPSVLHMWQAAVERGAELPEDAPALETEGSCGD